MASINKVIIVGNLGADPEVRYTPNGDQIASIRVATTEYWKDRNTGERQERTEWHRISLFGRTAETAGKYLKKGSQVYIEGRLRTRKYTGNDGIERYATDIHCDNMQMLGSRQGMGGSDSFDGNGGYDNGGYQGGNGGGYQQRAPRQQGNAGNSYSQARQGSARPGSPSGGDVPPDFSMDDDIPF